MKKTLALIALAVVATACTTSVTMKCGADVNLSYEDGTFDTNAGIMCDYDGVVERGE